jgi:predicted site-specific integrase-resolvase
MTMERLLTEQDVAKRLGVSVRTVQNWRREGGIGPACVIIGKHTIRYRMEDVLSYEESCLNKSKGK